MSALAPRTEPPPLIDAFAVVGLSGGEPLVGIAGEGPGWVGAEVRYRPAVTDSLATHSAPSQNERGAKLPTHFAMVSALSVCAHACTCQMLNLFV